MDLGIKGKKAIVCAASKGLGRGVAEALAANGAELTICARTKAEIEQTAGEIAAKYGVKVTPIACDVTTEEGRAGLTGGVAALARRVVRHNVVINNILPGPFETDRLRSSSHAIAEKSGKSFEEVHAQRQAEIPAGRFGTTEEFGAAAAFFCSQHAGYITGQNLVLDAGGINTTI